MNVACRHHVAQELIAGCIFLFFGVLCVFASSYSSEPRLPDDMRDVAQSAADAFHRQDYDEAAAKYQSIIQKYPDCLYAWTNLGVVRFQQGHLADAEHAFDRALKLHPEDAFTLANLGVVDFQLNRFDDAIAKLEAAVTLNPNDASAHSFLGLAYRRMGREKDAQRELRKASQLDKSFQSAPPF
jgi:Flp pilus assembly protein TadD